MLSHRVALAAIAVALLCRPVAAQQRPLVTEDAEPIGAGRMLVEAGVDFANEQDYPASGLTGDLWRIPAIGMSFGISSIAELQIDGGFYNRLSISKRVSAPLSSLVTATGESTHDIEDLVVATKVRLVSEAPGRPAFAVRLATKLPNASNESGLGLDTTDFMAQMLVAKGVQSVRIVGNVGLGILADPTSGNRQNDVLLYGASIARALSDRGELVAELNGRENMRSAGPFPGTESRSSIRFGARYTSGSMRVDAAMLVGLTTIGPSFGFTGGLTYVFSAFTVP